MAGALRNMIDLGNNKYQNNLSNLECENIYTCLPLYHLAGGVLGTCQVLVFGDTMSIAKRFSASRFWTDCIKFQCTAAQYIGSIDLFSRVFFLNFPTKLISITGEICRYLLAQKESPADKQHNVTIVFGNGLRPKIWRDFVTRFNIKQVGEFYGSTEGNANISTIDFESTCNFDD